MIIREDTQDLHVLKDVFFDNEYRLEWFDRDDVVIDIGANCGIFAIACRVKGCKQIICYEPETGNFESLEYNTLPHKNHVEIHQAAVWRSDRDENIRLQVMSRANSASHRVSQVGAEVRTVKLDDILRRFEKVALLKIDAEGSEYPILFTSKELHRCKKIIGEIHPMIKYADFPWESSVAGVQQFLTEQGFDVVMGKAGADEGYLRLFFATKKVHHETQGRNGSASGAGAVPQESLQECLSAVPHP